MLGLHVAMVQVEQGEGQKELTEQLHEVLRQAEDPALKAKDRRKLRRCDRWSGLLWGKAVG